MTLFREEVLTKKIENLHGAINLAIPVSWQIITVSLGAILGVAALFLCSASYSRTELASGSVVPSGGILQVIPSRPGQVEEVMVKEGQIVRRGQLLAKIRVEETDQLGTGTQTGILSAIELQRHGLLEQQALSDAARVSEQRGFGAQIAGLREENANISAQIAVQKRLVEMARTDLLQASQIASRGFISRRDIAVREETLLSREQQLAVLKQTQAAKLSGIEQAALAQRQASAKASGATAALAMSQAQIERERLTTRGDKGYALVAPATGRVAALNLNVGDAVNAQDAPMMIVAANGQLIAKLNVPGKAAGFVRVGQSVRLALDAYPSDRFGTVDGLITSVSSAPAVKVDRNGITTTVYVATAQIAKPTVSAYGQRYQLIPGMTFTARIVGQRRSLLEWIFDPLLAAVRQ